jgi:hypothetical protein
MRKQLLLLLLITIINTYSVNAQNEQTIEVIVTDTTILKANKIVYEISPASKVTWRESADKKHDSVISKDNLIALLNQKNIRYEQAPQTNFSINNNGNEDPPVFLVKLNSEQELANLYSLLKEEKGIAGIIKNVEYEPFDIYKETLFRRLYATALSDAKLLAKLSGKSIVDLISISPIHLDPIFQGFGDITNQMMENNVFFGRQGSRMEKANLTRLVYKFRVK